MTKKIILLFITVFSFSTGVMAGTNFMDYIFRDYNLAVAEAVATESAENTQEGGKVYSTTGSVKQEENSSTNEKSSPNNETENTNDDGNEVIKIADASFRL